MTVCDRCKQRLETSSVMKISMDKTSLGITIPIVFGTEACTDCAKILEQELKRTIEKWEKNESPKGIRHDNTPISML